MIDTHCHIDMYDDPIHLATKMEANKTECVAVTMLPSHYIQGVPHLARFNSLHPSLGMHPLRVMEGKNEIDTFIALAKNTEFIGEIGLDFSREGAPTKKVQLAVLKEIVESIKAGKFVTVHSRGSAADLLLLLEDHKVGPVCFHYFTAGISAAKDAISSGHYLSFNRRMLKGKHKELFAVVPMDRVLVESDGPFLTKSPVTAIKETYEMISAHWELPLEQVISVIAKNFSRCRTNL